MSTQKLLFCVSDVRNGERSRDDWRSSDPLSQADTESGLSQLSQVNPVLLSQQSNASRLLADGRETPRSQTRGRAENPDSALLKKCAALLRQHRSVELVPLFQKELVCMRKTSRYCTYSHSNFNSGFKILNSGFKFKKSIAYQRVYSNIYVYIERIK